MLFYAHFKVLISLVNLMAGVSVNEVKDIVADFVAILAAVGENLPVGL